MGRAGAAAGNAAQARPGGCGEAFNLIGWARWRGEGKQESEGGTAAARHTAACVGGVVRRSSRPLSPRHTVAGGGRASSGSRAAAQLVARHRQEVEEWKKRG